MYRSRVNTAHTSFIADKLWSYCHSELLLFLDKLRLFSDVYATPPVRLYCKVYEILRLALMCSHIFIHLIYLYVTISIGYVNEYPKMHYFGNPRHTQPMIANKILNEYFWKFQCKLHCGILLTCPITMPTGYFQP